MNSADLHPGFRRSAVTALFVLFFLQLITNWIESMYRMGVIKTSMGSEMFGMLLMFAPLLLLLVPKRLESLTLRFSVIAVLLARTAIPLLGVRANIVVAGVGVAASVVIMAFVFSGAYAELRDGLGAGAVCGLLMSIAAHGWGSSYDLTLGGPGVIIGWLLVGAAAVLIFKTSQPIDQSNPTDQGNPIDQGNPTDQGSTASIVVLSIALFANVAVVYWVLSSPAVITAWTESNYLVNVVLLVGAWSTALWQLKRLARLSSGLLILWNTLFVVSLVGGIILHTPPVPMTVAASPLIVATPPLSHQIPIHLMCWLSPVVLVNIQRIANQEFSLRRAI